MTGNQKNVDVYEQITSSIVTAIEQGAERYQMPWHTLSTPINAATQKAYRGINVLNLWIASSRSGYSSPVWATYRQWSEIGAPVRRGARSTTVVFWKFFDRESEDNDAPADTEESSEPRSRCFARAYHVFNSAQVDGYQPAPASPALSETQRIQNAEAFFAALPGTVQFGGDRAFYSPSSDSIQMPPFVQFKSPAKFYSVLSHEYCHWSGALFRLNRDLSGRFGDESYSFEELIAELGAAFVGSDLQLPVEPRLDHAPYIASWLRVLRDNQRAIFTAASQAQVAATYLSQLVGNAQERAS